VAADLPWTHPDEVLGAPADMQTDGNGSQVIDIIEDDDD
jgi:hypothetical protein